MCGIAGLIQSESKGAIDQEILRSMNASLTHRGPDDEGYWQKENVGLAMRRLSIIDLEGGHQPISNETGEVWTVFNGEIYNFIELREELTGKGHRFRSRTDTEVIVHLYEEEGESFVSRLRGMFAIALWDDRSRKLLLYRDRVGIKPLHYWFKDKNLVFASEIKAILEYPEVSRELSLSALSDYLGLLYVPAPKTIYQEIAKLPPGHFLRYENGRIEIREYWDFCYPSEMGIREEEWGERLREVLRESVKRHLVSDVPIGAFLSGGLDSSTVVAWMSYASSEKAKTYSIGFSDERFNELPYASRVARHFGTDHHEKIVKAQAFELLPKILSGFDEPFADSSAIPTYLVSEFARREVKVALSGDGGDELFAGYLWTRKEIGLERFRQIPSFLRRPLEKSLLGEGYRPLREKTFWSAVQRFVYDAQHSPAESFGRRAMSFQPWMKRSLFHPGVLPEEDKGECAERFRSLFSSKPEASLMDRLLYLDSKVYLPDDLLTKVDRMSMIHSLEVRVPLLDHKVVELACSIPFSLKVKGVQTKSILKRAMKGILPPEILKQRKQGFSVPLDRWFREDLSSWGRRLLLEDSPQSGRYFRREAVRSILDQHQKGAQRYGSQIYALLVFEIWCRLFQGGRGKPQTDLLMKDLVR